MSRTLVLLAVTVVAGCSLDEAGRIGDLDADVDVGPGPRGLVIGRTFVESAADIANPERGFYHDVDLIGGGSTNDVAADGLSIGYAEVWLDAYRDAPIDDAFLARLVAGLASVRRGGVKVVIRFTYNHDASGTDASRARILEHLAQLTPILQASSDVIVSMEAGFIGAWGEWHDSEHGLDNPADRTAILRAILDALPPSRMVQVRTPMFKQETFPGGALTDAEAWSGSDWARVGHHDDCFLAGESDEGTYAPSYDEWKAYVAQDSRYTPTGGETCRRDPRTSCASALAELTAHHWSFLNATYSMDVLDGWRAEGCYDEIRRRLGYRFAVERASWTGAVPPGGEVDLTVQLRNSGFAAPFNARPVYAVVAGPATRWVVRVERLDPRRLAPGTSTTFSTRLRIPASAPAGVYTLALWLPDEAPALADDPRYAVRFANDAMWNPATGDNVLTRELVIDPAAG